MSYHPPMRWQSDGTLRTAARGQEFVAAPTIASGAMDWIEAIIREGI